MVTCGLEPRGLLMSMDIWKTIGKKNTEDDMVTFFDFLMFNLIKNYGRFFFLEIFCFKNRLY